MKPQTDLRRIRRALDLKQSEVARCARCSVPTVSLVERGMSLKGKSVARIVVALAKLEAEQQEEP